MSNAKSRESKKESTADSDYLHFEYRQTNNWITFTNNTWETLYKIVSSNNNQFKHCLIVLMEMLTRTCLSYAIEVEQQIEQKTKEEISKVKNSLEITTRDCKSSKRKISLKAVSILDLLSKNVTDDDIIEELRRQTLLTEKKYLYEKADRKMIARYKKYDPKKPNTIAYKSSKHAHEIGREAIKIFGELVKKGNEIKEMLQRINNSRKKPSLLFKVLCEEYSRILYLINIKKDKNTDPINKMLVAFNEYVTKFPIHSIKIKSPFRC